MSSHFQLDPEQSNNLVSERKFSLIEIFTNILMHVEYSSQ